MRYNILLECVLNNEKECLPDIIPCTNPNDWNNYINNLYNDYFVPDFLNSKIFFMGLPVYIRPEPRYNNWEHGFIHMTHRDYSHNSHDPNDRVPDFRRSERLPWVKRTIENYSCSVDNDCDEILYWEELYRGFIRVNLLYEYEAFQVVLEKRKNHYMIITSFQLDEEWELEKRIRKYEKYKKQKTPLE